MSRAASSKSSKKDGSKSVTNMGTSQAAIGGQEELKKLQDELALERQERNYFQLERVI
jgi:hypothetical protein